MCGRVFDIPTPLRGRSFVRRTVPLRRLLSPLLALGLVLAVSGTAAAVQPTGSSATVSNAAPGSGGSAGRGGKTARGFDISYPQCGAPYPANPAFGIVGVNGGRVFSVNSCRASQITWGGGASAELYINTGNPGPALSSFWPL